MTINTTIGWCYCATFTQNGTISDANGTILAVCKAGNQTTFQATTTQTVISDDAATVLPVDGGPSAAVYSSAAGESSSAEPIEVDQEFDATSANAQSGIAVQQAVKLGGGSTPSSVSIGQGSQALNSNSNTVTIGYNALTRNINSVSIGAQVSSNGQEDVTLGSSSSCSGSYSVAIGSGITSKYNSCIAIGRNVTTEQYGGIALGVNSHTVGAASVALGAEVYNPIPYSTAILVGTENENNIGTGNPYYQVHFFLKDGYLHIGLIAQNGGNVLASSAYNLSQLTSTSWNPTGFKNTSVEVETEE